MLQVNFEWGPVLDKASFMVSVIKGITGKTRLKVFYK